MGRLCVIAMILLMGAMPAIAGHDGDRALACVSLVEKASRFVQEKGRDYATKAFSCSKGPFIDKELYIFALSMDNVMLAHPWQADLVGKRLDDFKDVDGTYLFREFKEVAKTRGAGWIEYKWWLPGEDKQVPKRSFIKVVPGADMYVGAGYYP